MASLKTNNEKFPIMSLQTSSPSSSLDGRRLAHPRLQRQQQHQVQRHACSVKTAAERKLQALLSSGNHSYHSINCPPADQHSRLHYATLSFDPVIMNGITNHAARLSVTSDSSSSLSNLSIGNCRLSRSCDHLVKDQIAPKVSERSCLCKRVLSVRD